MLTAVLGALIFRESLPGKRRSEHATLADDIRANACIALWWLGASFLVAGSVIIGRREEGKDVGVAGTAGSEPAVAAQEGFRDEPDAPLAPADSAAGSDAAAYKDSIELERKPHRNPKSVNKEDDEQ